MYGYVLCYVPVLHVVVVNAVCAMLAHVACNVDGYMLCAVWLHIVESGCMEFGCCLRCDGCQLHAV